MAICRGSFLHFDGKIARSPRVFFPWHGLLFLSLCYIQMYQVTDFMPYHCYKKKFSVLRQNLRKLSHNSNQISTKCIKQIDPNISDCGLQINEL